MNQGHAPSGDLELYYRSVGSGPPVIVVHGGPDFDHRYFLPDMDRLADGYRLVYYDQRGRGRSRGPLRLEEVTIDNYVGDLDAVRRHLGLDRVAVLGHSWGGHLALHYALRHPERLSHLVLLNPAPASYADTQLMRAGRAAKRAPVMAKLEEIYAGDAFTRGDPDAVEAFYKLDFGTTFKRAADADRLSLRFTREQTLLGREIEDQLIPQVYGGPGFDLLPRLARIPVPALVLHGDIDFIPVECSQHIADAIPGARLAVLRDSGHFSYIDAGDAMRRALDSFMNR